MVSENHSYILLPLVHLQLIKYTKNQEPNFSKRQSHPLEDDDHKPVDFNSGTIGFTCQLIKIKKRNELKND